MMNHTILCIMKKFKKSVVLEDILGERGTNSNKTWKKFKGRGSESWKKKSLTSFTDAA